MCSTNPPSFSDWSALWEAQEKRRRTAERKAEAERRSIANTERVLLRSRERAWRGMELLVEFEEVGGTKKAFALKHGLSGLQLASLLHTGEFHRVRIEHGRKCRCCWPREYE